MDVRDTLTIYDGKVAKARAAIEQCRKNDAALTAYINDPERKYDEWLQWPEHRRRIEDYEATLPDAPRSRAKCATPVVTPSGDTVSYVPTAAFPEI